MRTDSLQVVTRNAYVNSNMIYLQIGAIILAVSVIIFTVLELWNADRTDLSDWEIEDFSLFKK